MVAKIFMDKSSYSQKELNRLINKYILYLDIYLSTLYKTYKKAEKSCSLNYHHIEFPKTNEIKRFILVGRKIQDILEKLQKKNS